MLGTLSSILPAFSPFFRLSALSPVRGAATTTTLSEPILRVHPLGVQHSGGGGGAICGAVDFQR